MNSNKKVSLRGEITVPGDKSISHRAIMFGSIAQGTTEITGFLNSADCHSTIGCFKQMVLLLLLLFLIQAIAVQQRD